MEAQPRQNRLSTSAYSANGSPYEGSSGSGSGSKSSNAARLPDPGISPGSEALIAQASIHHSAHSNTFRSNSSNGAAAPTSAALSPGASSAGAARARGIANPQALYSQPFPLNRSPSSASNVRSGAAYTSISSTGPQYSKSEMSASPPASASAAAGPSRAGMVHSYSTQSVNSTPGGGNGQSASTLLNSTPGGGGGGGSAASRKAKVQSTIADELAEAVGSKKDRKRKRVHYSCAECHRRKHKCDRQIPCKPCVDRGIGDDCRPFEDGDQHGDVKDRISRLEDIVEGLAVAQTTLAKELAEVKGISVNPSGAGGLSNLAGLAAMSVKLQQMEGELSAVRGQQGAAAAAAVNGAGTNGANSSMLASRAGSKGPGDEDDAQAQEGEVRGAKRFRRGRGDNKNDPDAHELEIERRTLDGQFANDGESWFGALALPSVSRGVIETEVSRYLDTCFERHFCRRRAQI